MFNPIKITILGVCALMVMHFNFGKNVLLVTCFNVILHGAEGLKRCYYMTPTSSLFLEHANYQVYVNLDETYLFPLIPQEWGCSPSGWNTGVGWPGVQAEGTFLNGTQMAMRRNSISWPNLTAGLIPGIWLLAVTGIMELAKDARIETRSYTIV